MSSNFLFTSESVSEGHPDKVADQISDAILDAILAEDKNSRVAAETLVTTGLVVLAGEITTHAVIDYQTVARDVIKRIGYDNSDFGIDYKGCAVLVCYDTQSPGHRAGRRRGQGPGPRPGRGRPGPDVRLCLRRDAGTDAAADLLLAPPRRAPGRAAPRRRACRGCDRTPRARSRSATSTASRTRSTRSCCRRSTIRTSRTKT